LTAKCLLSADFVEKRCDWMKVMASASHLARGYLLDVPASVQMMDFVGETG